MKCRHMNPKYFELSYTNAYHSIYSFPPGVKTEERGAQRELHKSISWSRHYCLHNKSQHFFPQSGLNVYFLA